MNWLIERRNTGISSVFGSVLILLLVLTLASALFLSLYAYEEKAEESITLEEERTQEKIVLLSLSTENVSGTEYLTAIFINNTGTITTRIRAVYIDNNFVCDPTNPLLNPNDTYINPKDSLWIQIPSNLEYKPFSKIEVATERGMKSVEYEWKLKTGSQAEPPSEIQRFYFGPLLLNFEKFYYTENYGSYDPNSWKPGWSVEKGATVVWNVTVTNIDDRDLTINKYSGFTLVSNDGGVQKPWFIEPPNGLDTLFIASNTTVHLIYIWDRPRMTQGVSNQSVYNQNDRSKVFLTFFGIFHEHDGSTKPYGQTIPFEAVLVRDPQMVITAAPTVIAAGSAMTSTITVTVRDVMGILAVNVPVTFTTTLGTLSSSTVTTNSNGIATVTLSPGSTTGTAVITATWEGVSKSVSVTIASGTLSLSANPSTIAAGSTMTSTITARVTLNGNPLMSETVSFSATPNLGTLSSTTATTNAQGYATVTFTPGTETGTTTITAAWGTLTQPTSVTITSGALSLTATPSTVAAGSTMISTITARVTLNGNPLSGETVTFSATPTLGSLSSTTATTNAQGYATVTLTPGTNTGTMAITAAWGTLIQSTSVIITSGGLSISADPSTVAAGSTMVSTITVRATLDGSPLMGETVSFSATPNIGTLLPATATTNAEGYATATFTPGTETGTTTITAAWGILTQSTSITIASGSLSISADPSTIAAGSTMSSTITATILLNGSPVADTLVSFATDRGTLSSYTATTNSVGEVTVTLTPSTTPGNANVSVTWQGLSASTIVNMAACEVLVQAAPTTITANTAETAEITATILLDGSPVANAVVTFATNSTQVTLSSTTASTNDFGIATVTLSPGTTAEYVEVTATWENITGLTYVTIV